MHFCAHSSGFFFFFFLFLECRAGSTCERKCMAIGTCRLKRARNVHLCVAKMAPFFPSRLLRIIGAKRTHRRRGKAAGATHEAQEGRACE